MSAVETAETTEKILRGIAQAWNRSHPIGTEVTFWPGVLEGEGISSKTRSEAWLMPSGQVVALIEGYAGSIAISHILPKGA